MTFCRLPRWPLRSLLLASLIISTSSHASELTLLVGDNPPFNSFVHGKPEGMAVDVVGEMLKRSALSAKQYNYPWARALQTAATTPNHCVYTLGRLAEREKRYVWIGPIARIQGVFFGLRERQLQLKSLDDARKLRIGDLRQGANAVWLEQLGFKIDYANTEEQNIKKLLAGHIDLYPASLHAGPEIARRMQIPPQSIVPLLAFNQLDLYLGCSPNTPSPLIKRLTQALAQMRSDQSLKQIEARYSPQLQIAR
ncbi:ABC transporter substrate-binding protein [Chitinibacter sp. GC72]|uniref:substrate-binding periplasmic protein n=1 Tax=Chitinibacter sp. GC72 TaxID=1526917 RepID=UPI0012F8410E|nr:transporter substrate-binding domain-containing protein [Chitinibacter sp. GC72]